MEELKKKLARVQTAVTVQEASKAELDAALLDLTQFLVGKTAVPAPAATAPPAASPGS